MITLYEHQKKALEKMHNGCVLVGDVGSGKSITALAYFFQNECGGKLSTKLGIADSPMKHPKPLYIITTAKKRNQLEWDGDAIYFGFSKLPEYSLVPYTVDSWNNIGKYEDVTDSFFIFDEQHVVGSGSWVKTFLKIAKRNRWILLSATPGDTWMDYVPLFLANGFYRNRSEFIRRHVIYSRYAKFPKIERYVDCDILSRYKEAVVVYMPFVRNTKSELVPIQCEFDKHSFDRIYRGRWNIFEDRPIMQAGEWCYLMRRVANSSPDRVAKLLEIVEKTPKSIIFYNFDYELELMKEALSKVDIVVAEYNGHRHENIPKADRWCYLVQYNAGSEAWNCIETDTIIFYSLNYSYKCMVQSSGRINRVNTPFYTLYYYILYTESTIDRSIRVALRNKRDFNENKYIARRNANVRSHSPERDNLPKMQEKTSGEEERIMRKYDSKANS